MQPDLAVDITDLHRTARAVADLSEQTSSTAVREPTTQVAPRWSATDAARSTTDAARMCLAQVSAELSDTARHITTTAEAYEDADAAAAAWLRLA